MTNNYFQNPINIVVVDGLHFFDCKSCGKRSSTKANAMKHFKQLHGEKKFKCEVCEKPFALKDAMKRHFEDIHEKKKEYVCGKCNKSFSRASYGKQHYNRCKTGNL